MCIGVYIWYQDGGQHSGEGGGFRSFNPSLSMKSADEQKRPQFVVQVGRTCDFYVEMIFSSQQSEVK